jgi:Mg2+ and Co2+ transporter CorA
VRRRGRVLRRRTIGAAVPLALIPAVVAISALAEGIADRPPGRHPRALERSAGIGKEEGRYLRDVQDHAIRAEEHADAFRALLQNILSVNLTLETKALTEASHAQNEQVKRISAWARRSSSPRPWSGRTTG